MEYVLLCTNFCMICIMILKSSKVQLIQGGVGGLVEMTSVQYVYEPRGHNFHKGWLRMNEAISK